jgi:uncharacterized membrane protein YeiH
VGISLLGVVEIAAVASFAYTGAEVARARRMDVVGLASLAVVNGLAGGVVRDVLIGQPVLALHDARLLPTCLAVAAVVALFGSVARPWLIESLDAVGLGLFTVLGAARALDAGVTSLAAILLGSVTVAAGSVARDVLAGERPAVLYRSELYVIASCAGAALFVTGHRIGVRGSGWLLGVAASATALRLVARSRGWRSPVPLDAAAPSRRTRG